MQLIIPSGLRSQKNIAADARNPCERRRWLVAKNLLTKSFRPLNGLSHADKPARGYAGLRSRAHRCWLWRCDALVLAVRFLLRGLAAFTDVDAALEVGAVFNRYARRYHIPGE